MTTMAINAVYCERPALKLTITIPVVFWVWLERRRQRRLYARLSRLSPHLIRDMGIDPEDVRDAVAGTWDEIDPGRIRIR